MKPLLTTTACFIAATVVCAHISNDDSGSLLDNKEPVIQASDSEASFNPVGDFSPSMYGVIGAAAMALLIATRRQRV